MNKNRVETISDGVFAIVMTLLIFDVKVAVVTGGVSDAHLWRMIGALWPLFISYAFSFVVLSVFWINHHFLFHAFARNVNRQLNLLNMIYLLFLAFIPFSAHLLGTYYDNQPAVLVYGLNMLAAVSMSVLMQRYVRNHPDLRNQHLSSRVVTQARIRNGLSVASYVSGLIASFVYLPLSIFLFLFPILFNIIPGSLNFFERLFDFEIT